MLNVKKELVLYRNILMPRTETKPSAILTRVRDVCVLIARDVKRCLKFDWRS